MNIMNFLYKIIKNISQYRQPCPVDFALLFVNDIAKSAESGEISIFLNEIFIFQVKIDF